MHICIADVLFNAVCKKSFHRYANVSWTHSIQRIQLFGQSYQKDRWTEAAEPSSARPQIFIFIYFYPFLPSFPWFGCGSLFSGLWTLPPQDFELYAANSLLFCDLRNRSLEFRYYPMSSESSSTYQRARFHPITFDGESRSSYLRTPWNLYRDMRVTYSPGSWQPHVRVLWNYSITTSPPHVVH